MMIAMMLFGSAARGDGTSNSDTDILLIRQSGEPTGIKKDGAEIQILSAGKLIQMATEGDLFAIHLALEGKIIFDYECVFSKFKESLKIKKSYKKEIKLASDFGWFLARHANKFSNTALINKRIAWCTRTILISKLANGGRFIFSPQGLHREFPDNYVGRLLDLRRSLDNSLERTEFLMMLLNEVGLREPYNKSQEGFISHFRSTNNNVALSSIKVLTNEKLRSLDSPY